MENKVEKILSLLDEVKGLIVEVMSEPAPETQNDTPSEGQNVGEGEGNPKGEGEDDDE